MTQAETGQAIIRYLLDYTVPDHGRTVSIGALATSARIDLLARATFHEYGMAIAENHRGQRSQQPHGKCWLFLVPSVVEDRILAGSPWGATDWVAQVLAIPGTTFCQRSIGKRRPYGPLVPLWPFTGGVRPFAVE